MSEPFKKRESYEEGRHRTLSAKVEEDGSICIARTYVHKNEVLDEDIVLTQDEFQAIVNWARDEAKVVDRDLKKRIEGTLKDVQELLRRVEEATHEIDQRHLERLSLQQDTNHG